MNLNNKYLLLQNGIVLSSHDNIEDATKALDDEKQKDLLSIMFRRRLRKLFKKSGNVALHTYSIIYSTEVKSE